MLGGKLLPAPAAQTAPGGEPGGPPVPVDTVDALLWLLFLADGRHSLLDTARRSGVPFRQLRDLALVLCREGLLAPQDADA